jgi:hypothetical protein
VRKDLFKGVLIGALAVLVIGGGTLGAMAAIGDGGIVTTCFNKSLGTWKPINTTTGHHCPTGTQTIVFYTKDQVDSLIASVTPTHHILTIYEDESSGNTNTASGAGSNDVYGDFIAYVNEALVAPSISQDDWVYTHTTDDSRFISTITFLFNDGSTIEATGPYPNGGGDQTVAITGGTGSYKGANGQLTVEYSQQVGNALPIRLDWTVPA